MGVLAKRSTQATVVPQSGRLVDSLAIDAASHHVHINETCEGVLGGFGGVGSDGLKESHHRGTPRPSLAILDRCNVVDVWV